MKSFMTFFIKLIPYNKDLDLSQYIQNFFSILLLLLIDSFMIKDVENNYLL